MSSFVFAVLLIPSLNVLSDYFLFVNLVAVPTVRMLIKVVTQWQGSRFKRMFNS